MKIKFYLWMTGLLLAASTIVSLGFGGATAAALRYCDDNSIIRCGALTASELQQKYNANEDDVKAIFSHYGISSSMVANASTAKVGTVTKTGDVIVDGKVVATSAQTVGRQNVSGSTAVTINGKTYYQRTPADVFIVDSQDAFVFLDSNGKFVAAILQPCGNPIVATAKETVKQTATYTCTGLTVTPVSRTKYEFKATRTVQNAEYINTTFVVRDSANKELLRMSNTEGVLTYDQATAGTYSVEAIIKAKVGGVEKTSPATAACKKTFTVAAAPAYECSGIQVVEKSRNTFNFTVTTKAEGGATLKQISIDFGDGETAVAQNGQPVSHTYAQADTYDVIATPTFTVDGADKTAPNEACETQVTVDEEPEEVLGETTPPPTEEPEELPSTGPIAVIGSIAAPGALGLGIASYLRSRRAIKNALRE